MLQLALHQDACYAFPLFLQDQRGKAKMCCVISESLGVISRWEWCPLPVANVLKTGPRDKDCRRGNYWQHVLSGIALVK